MRRSQLWADLGKELSRQMESTCKGPEVGVGLVCRRNRQKACQAEAKGARGSDVTCSRRTASESLQVRDVMGSWTSMGIVRGSGSTLEAGPAGSAGGLDVWAGHVGKREESGCLPHQPSPSPGAEGKSSPVFTLSSEPVGHTGEVSRRRWAIGSRGRGLLM